MSWSEIFSARIPHIFFIYGLAFFALGLAVLLETGCEQRSHFRWAMRPLAFFGLVHGSHEWIEMFSIVGVQTYNFRPSATFEGLRLFVLAVSFALLAAFGARMLHPRARQNHFDVWLSLGFLCLYAVELGTLARWLSWGGAAWLAAADALARYSLAIPGAVLAAAALFAQRRAFLRSNQLVFANDLFWAALAFLLYGVVGQLFIGASPLFPSSVVNSQTFQHWFGFPIQLFRAAMATTIAIFTIRALRAFEFNRRQELEAARRQVAEEIVRRDDLRQEFLHRVVQMQEEERGRIARELHDELGQALTGLAIGLRGAQTSLSKPELLQAQLGQLEEMAVRAIGDMRQLINELRPALLDDMGLRAALRQHMENFAEISGIQVTLTISQDYDRLPKDVETVLFRVSQEALTNVARHAKASRAWVDLICDEDWAFLRVKDDGLGFTVQSVFSNGGKQPAGWGLIGIQERVKLIGGEVQLESEPGKGTVLSVRVPVRQVGGIQDATYQTGTGG